MGLNTAVMVYRRRVYGVPWGLAVDIGVKLRRVMPSGGQEATGRVHGHGGHATASEHVRVERDRDREAEGDRQLLSTARKMYVTLCFCIVACLLCSWTCVAAWRAAA